MPKAKVTLKEGTSYQLSDRTFKYLKTEYIRDAALIEQLKTIPAFSVQIEEKKKKVLPEEPKLSEPLDEAPQHKPKKNTPPATKGVITKMKKTKAKKAAKKVKE